MFEKQDIISLIIIMSLGSATPVPFPLLDNFKAPLVAELDASKIKMYIDTGLENAVSNLTEALLEQVQGNVDKSVKDALQDINAKIDGINAKLTNGYHQNPFECLSGWKSYSAHCYYFAYEHITWPEAKTACEKRNSYLVKIDTSTENDWIKERMSERPFNFMWIGLNDIETEGYWTWVSDSTGASFTNWLSGEPNGHRAHNCAHLWGDHSYQWNDVPCNGRQYGYICEQNKS